MTKRDCIACGEPCEEYLLDSEGVCEPCNLEDYCPDCNQHELDCECDDSFIYGFGDDDFEDDDDYNEEDDWEGDDWDEDEW